jgi:signal recognition particle receptor subunit beta
MMAGCALLVIATKQDLADAVSLELIQQVFELSKLRQPWKLIATTINNKQTLAEGFDWLAQTSP